MDKEKIIEEMAKDIDNRLLEARNYLGSMNKGEGYWIAEELIKHYRKINDNEVVISKEEYEKLKQEQTISYTAMINGSYLDRIEDLENRLLNARKETAREILVHLYNRDEMGYDVLKWYAKEYWGIELG